LIEIAKILLVDQNNAEALHLEEVVRREQDKVREEEYKKIKTIPKDVLLESYKRTLVDAWMDGNLCVEELATIETRKGELEISETEHAKLEREAQILSYEENLKIKWRSGSIDQTAQEELERLREEMNISAEQHSELEQKVRRQTGSVNNSV
jgi:hypothetical protein